MGIPCSYAKSVSWAGKTRVCAYCRSPALSLSLIYLIAAAEQLPRAHLWDDGADQLQDVLQGRIWAAASRRACGCLPLLPTLQNTPSSPRWRRLVQGALGGYVPLVSENICNQGSHHTAEHSAIFGTCTANSVYGREVHSLALLKTPAP